MEELDDEYTPLPVEEPLPPTPVDPSSEEPPILVSSTLPPPPSPYLRQTVYRISPRHSLDEWNEIPSTAGSLLSPSRPNLMWGPFCGLKVLLFRNLWLITHVYLVLKLQYTECYRQTSKIDNSLSENGHVPCVLLVSSTRNLSHDSSVVCTDQCVVPIKLLIEC
jgi:hypothetical protein